VADTKLSTLKGALTETPEAQRLKEELSGYLQARARKTVSDLGDRLGQGLNRLGESGGGAASTAVAKGREALDEGRSPARALAAAGKSHLKETLKGKAKEIFGKGRKSGGGGGSAKRVTIVEDIDVGVPVREAYDQWTQFQEFSTFAKGVVSVESVDDTSANWKVKVAKSTRSWRSNVTEQVPDERIAWTTEGAKGTVRGAVTFHPLTEDLTRVLLVLEYFPKGFMEKTGNIWRAQGRRARLDLKRYRTFVMLRGEAPDGWRGEIRDGEVVVDHEDAVREEEASAGARDEEPRDDEPREEEPPEDELPEDEAAEDEAAGDEAPEDEAADDDLPDEEYADDDEFADEDLAEDAEPDEDELPEDEPAEDELPEEDVEAAEDAEDEDAEPVEDADDPDEEEPAEECGRRRAGARTGRGRS
jgi:uncharacterized membrane protein